MIRRMLFAVLMGAVLLLCIDGGTGCTAAQETPGGGALPVVELELAFKELSFEKPVFLGHDGADNDFLYVVEQNGKIFRFENNPEAEEKTLWLDLSPRIPNRKHNEEGLLALAFHPEFRSNGYFYVHYSMHAKGDKPRRGVTSRFTYNAAKDTVAIESEKIIMEIKQPWGNHNGCMLLFGDDGYLYSSFGDGGAAGDPHNNGLDLSTLKGSVLRIDVDKEEDGKAYAIPEDNPFVDCEGARGEVWAYGLRNVWRMSFDPDTGLLWGADVGQNAYEEIDIIVKGGNYGWKAREGKHAYRGGEKTDDMIDPVAEYGRDKGISVTGGYVYRGKAQEALQGVYVYADYATGRTWGLTYDAEEKKVVNNELIGHFRNQMISSFGIDAENELYACIHNKGLIYRVVNQKKKE